MKAVARFLAAIAASMVLFHFVRKPTPREEFQLCFGLPLPESAKLQHEYHFARPDTVIYEEWFALALSEPDAEKFCAALQMQERERSFAYYSWPPESVRSWWKPATLVADPAATLRTWGKGTADSQAGSLFAVWSHDGFWIHRTGRHLGK